MSAASGRTSMYRDISAAELAARLRTDNAPFVLDVREPSEVAEWAIAGAVNIPAGELAGRVDALPGDREIVVGWASGNRSTAAAGYLARQDLTVANLAGGTLADGDTFALGSGSAFSVAALRTPGHTQGSTIYFVDDRVVLTGDTLFVDGVARPDLAERAEEFARNLYRSLHERVFTLPDDTYVLPGHCGDAVRVAPDAVVGARLGDLRTTLAPLSFDENAFVSWATERATPRPPNYVEIITANMGRSELSRADLARLEAGPNRCSV